MGVFDNAEFDNHESLHFFTDEPSGLRAIIAVHSTAMIVNDALLAHALNSAPAGRLG